MNYLKFIAVVFVLYFLGYVLGPTLSPMLVKERKAESGLTRTVEYKGAQYKINLAEYRDDKLPETVKIEKRTSIPTVSGEGKVNLEKGDIVTLLNREGESLIVEKADANGKGTVAPTDTDLFQQLAKGVYDREAGNGGGGGAAAVAQTKPEPKLMPKPEPEPRKPDPDPVAKVEPEAMEPKPMAKPEPKVVERTPIPVSNGKLSDEEIIALMQESIKGGAVKEFKFEQVKAWKATGDETIDGTDYQTGLAAYDAATIFGVRAVQAKALIKDGKIERWVYAKSGMEIQ